jgi:hypothetical protein
MLEICTVDIDYTLTYNPVTSPVTYSLVLSDILYNTELRFL